jgi:hypothetical protein
MTDKFIKAEKGRLVCKVVIDVALSGKVYSKRFFNKNGIVRFKNLTLKYFFITYNI